MLRRNLILTIVLAEALAVGATDLPAVAGEGDTMEHLSVHSSAFAPGASIPAKYTGEGEDVSPPLEWPGVPSTAKEIVVICDDPDAPRAEPWVHWVAYKIPATQSGLPEGASSGFVCGRNDFGKNGYGGPMPPRGHGVHRYHFRVYALGRALDAAPGMSKSEILSAIRNHVVAEGELIGTYERK